MNKSKAIEAAKGAKKESKDMGKKPKLSALEKMKGGTGLMKSTFSGKHYSV